MNDKESDQVLNSMTVGNDIVGDDDKSELYRAIQQLYEGKNLHFITDLSDTDIKNLVRLGVLSDYCDDRVPIMELLKKEFMKLRVSKNRQGRNEFFTALRPEYNMMGTGLQPDQGGFMRSMFRPRR